jgi:amino acid adenylation domain-containing protein
MTCVDRAYTIPRLDERRPDEIAADAHITDLFERFAIHVPERCAASDINGSVTYGQLNKSANRLAHHLLEIGGDREEPVAIVLGHGTPILTALLGALEAGKICVPCDASWPVARLAAMLEDSGAATVVTDALHEPMARSLAGSSRRVVMLESLSGSPATSNPALGFSPDRPAYLVYTSGSAGLSKGIVHTHRTALHNIQNYIRLLSICPDDRLVWLHSPSFSSAWIDILCTLLTGASLFAWDVRTQGLLGLADWLNQHEITAFHWSPSAFRRLCETLRGSSGLRTPRLLVLGSEPATRRDWQLYCRYFPDSCIMVNRLGATEVNNYRLYFLDKSAEPAGILIPAGFAVPGKEVIVVDQSGRPEGVDQVGQIVIRSRYCSPGYWRRPGLTSQAFLPDPADPLARLYHTGDRGLLRPDGCLEFRGRTDAQVKIRGYRVELEEIEHVLAEHEAVRSVAVTAHSGPDGVARLVAYIVPRQTPPPAPELRQHLRRRLPDYMVPAQYVFLESLPTTETGKLDRRALPPPPRQAPDTAGYLAPRDALEEELARIWSSVLARDRVGVQDNFFELGGDSLLAMLALSRVWSRLGRQVSVRLLLEEPTIAALAAKLRAMPDGGLGSADGIVARAADRSGAAIPLSFGQHRLWFLDQLEPNSMAYLLPFAWRLRGRVHVECLRRALEGIVHRHEPLRTAFRLEGDEPVPVVLPPVRFQLVTRDLSAQAPLRPEDLDRAIDAEVGVKFDLTRDVLLRAVLIRLADDDHVLVLAAHHIAFDGWSLGVLWRELAARYRALAYREPERTTELPVRYSDYAIWQRDRASSAAHERACAYWRDRLKDLATLELPDDHARPSQPSYRGASHRFQLDPDLSAQLEHLAEQAGVTLHVLLLAAFKVLLHRYSGQDDVTVGVPIAGRRRPELEDLIGFFVNTLAVRTDLSGSPSFREVLRRVWEVTLSGYDHEELPFEQLVALARPQRRLGRNPLFQVMFQYQTYSGDWDLDGLAVSRLPVHIPGATVDLEFRLREEHDAVGGNIVYSPDLFEPGTIERMAVHYKVLLGGIAANPDVAVADLPLMTAVELRQTLMEWNDTAADYPRNRCVHQLFEDQAARRPEAIAVVSAQGAPLTYRELNARANRLAHHLRSRGVGNQSCVGLCLARSHDLIVAILGILKAGGAYVPLDPSFPPARMKFVLRDAGVRALVTERAFQPILPWDEIPTTLMDRDAEILRDLPDYNPDAGSRPEDLVYVMYTSGSTGQPKGVMIEHRSVIRLVHGARYCTFGPDRTFLHLAPLAFDLSTFEIWGALLHGARLVLAPDGLPDLEQLEHLLSSQRVTTLWLTASLFNIIVESRLAALASVEEILAGGEALSVKHVRMAYQSLPGSVRLINGYGPTEATTFACCHPIPRELPPGLRSIPIGRPIANTAVYVRDAAGQPVPVGVPGELYIGGDGLARGYLNRPELTAAAFMNSPFQPAARLYRSGDRVRWLADGTLEFLGRFDNQIKLRGFRIELGEIEAALDGHPGVGRSVVVRRRTSSGDDQLVAYWTPSGRREIDGRSLARYLESKLPGFMLPAAIIERPELPINPNGKVDRAALPERGDEFGMRPEPAVPPRDELEEQLARLWAKELGVPSIGIHDNFFDHGGHSLLALRLTRIIERTLQRRLSPAALYEHPTIAELADHLRTGAEQPARPAFERLNQGSAGPSLIFAPLALGTSGYGRKLVPWLPPSLTVYGGTIRGVTPLWEGCRTLSDIAAGYLEELVATVPAGPFVLVGWSFAGHLAFEMARQMQARNIPVQLLVIIDTAIYKDRQSRWTRLTRDLPSMFVNLPRWLADAIRDPTPTLADRIRRRAEGVLRRSFSRRSPVEIKGLRLLEEHVDISSLPEAMRRRVELSLMAFEDYRPGRFRGRLAVLKSRIRRLVHRADRDLGWGKWVDGVVDVRTIPGNHGSIFDEPHIQELARAITDLIGQQDGSHRPGP